MRLENKVEALQEYVNASWELGRVKTSLDVGYKYHQEDEADHIALLEEIEKLNKMIDARVKKLEQAIDYWFQEHRE